MASRGRDISTLLLSRNVAAICRRYRPEKLIFGIGASLVKNAAAISSRRCSSMSSSSSDDDDYEAIQPRWIQWKDPASHQWRKSRLVSTNLSGQYDHQEVAMPIMKAHLVDDTTRASDALRLIRKSDDFLLYHKGDYHNARQLLTALKKRIVSPSPSSPKKKKQTTTKSTRARSGSTCLEEWEQHRKLKQELNSRANRLLLRVEADHTLASYRRAPEVSHILSKQIRASTTTTTTTTLHDTTTTTTTTSDNGEDDNRKEQQEQEDGHYLIPLQEILGRIGAYEWERKGIYLPQLIVDDDDDQKTLKKKKIHPQYSVFVPTRHEYLDLILQQPLPNNNSKRQKITICDVGTGTGVIAAMMLLHHNNNNPSNNVVIEKAIATDTNPYAIQCAADNFERFGLSEHTILYETDLFPPVGDGGGGDDCTTTTTTKFDLIICNPPWIPGPATTLLDRAVYDEDSRFLQSFLIQAPNHLITTTKEEEDGGVGGGEIWLVLSDLAEHLGLRRPDQVTQWIHKAGLEILDISETRPHHPKSQGNNNKKKGGSRKGERKALRGKNDHQQQFDAITAARSMETTKLYRLRPTLS